MPSRFRGASPEARSVSGFDVEDRTLFTLGHMILIADLANLFSVMSEIFTLGWAKTSHWATMKYLLFGLEHHGEVYDMLTPVMWLALALQVGAVLLLLSPKTRYRLDTLSVAAAAAFVGIFLEKGIVLFMSVFIVSPLGQVYEPSFTVPEAVIAASLWALGALVFTLLAKAAIGIRSETV